MEDNLIITGDVCCDDVQKLPSQDQCSTCVSNIDSVENVKDTENSYNEFVKLATVLQESILHSWKLHLKAKKYYVHLILEEYYDEAFDIIDGLIEHYQGICKCDIINSDIITDDVVKSYDPYTYFTSLKCYLLDFLRNPNNFNEKTNEIKSDIDDLLRLIDSTLYKLGNLTESKVKSYDEFVYENFNI